MPAWLSLLSLIVFLLGSGCAGSHTVLGPVRPAIKAEQVEYYDPPPKRFEEIAILDLPARATFAWSDEAKLAKIERKFREMAAKLGANGLVLQFDNTFHTYRGVEIPLSEETRAAWKRKEGRADALAIYVTDR